MQLPHRWWHRKGSARWGYLPYTGPRWKAYLRYYTRWPRRLFHRVERWPDDGTDYTGWSARMVVDVGPLKAGMVGTVTEFQKTKQGKKWIVDYDAPPMGVDFYTRLPAPETVELIEPTTA